VSTRFGRFELDEECRQLTDAGRAVPLSPKAFQLLQILVRERPKVVPKQTLIDELWPDTFVEEANVRNLIAEIRRATGADLIRTAHRFGYAFEGTAASSRSRGPAARLDDATNTYPLGDGVNVIGRDAACQVALDRRGVSRRHAQIRISDGSASIEDLGSKNGTWVNGTRITGAVPLNEGDSIRAGVVTLTYRVNVTDPSTETLNASRS
jgi:DNA-binding winged helix-turn-helix (wHTH) protein